MALIFVSGTGTEVGKTTVSAAALLGLRTHGHRVRGLKPIETGVGADGPADARALAAAADHALYPPAYAFSPPISPHLAARRANATIDLDTIRAWVTDHRGDAELVLVESAGGLFSPIGPDCTNCDLAEALAPDLHLIVALDRLGVLHDVTAVIRGCGPRRLPSPVVVMNQRDADHSSADNL
ncbi:MAG: dethiobiotin synthase, partial [Myxococcota bacterium]